VSQNQRTLPPHPGLSLKERENSGAVAGLEECIRTAGDCGISPFAEPWASLSLEGEGRGEGEESSLSVCVPKFFSAPYTFPALVST